MRCSNRETGFTLIEVLVAFMILALSLAVLFRIFSGGLTSVAVSGDYSRAIQVARSRLAAAGTSEPLLPGVSRGDDGERFHWQRTVSRYLPPQAADRPQGRLAAYSVTIDVYWETDGREKHISLESIRLQEADGVAG